MGLTGGLRSTRAVSAFLIALCQKLFRIISTEIVYFELNMIDTTSEREQKKIILQINTVAFAGASASSRFMTSFSGLLDNVITFQFSIDNFYYYSVI